MTDYTETVDINNVVTLKYGTKKGCFFGCGAIEKFAAICDDLKPSCVGFVSSKSAHVRSGAFAVLERILGEKNIPYLIYNKVVSNPMTDSIDECVKLFREKSDENFVVCTIGGGSPGDAGKSISTMLCYPEKTAAQLYKLEFAPEKRAKLVMINITSGTGTEVDSFAVASVNGANPPIKPCIAGAALYPDYSIDDPALTKTTNEFQTRYTAIDAMNHVMEGCSTIVATPFSVTLACQVTELVTKFLPIALKEPENLRARYWLMYAAAIAGMCFDESLLHLTHALEHTLSAFVPDLTHGLGLSIIQPGVMRHTWAKAGPVYVHCFPNVLKGLTGKPEEAQMAFDLMRAWHVSVGQTETMATIGFKKDQLDDLVDAVIKCPGMTGLIGLAPVPTLNEDIKNIFASGFFD
jgi:alcohol dehydrogenase class IV